MDKYNKKKIQRTKVGKLLSMPIKGVLLCGGKGTRLSPLTKVINKQLLPVFDKPIFYYSLSILMLAGIREVVIVINKEDLKHYKDLLGDGKRLGMSINYCIQETANGIPEGLKLTEKFTRNSKIFFMLGDNFFYGQGFTQQLKKFVKNKSGASIFLYPVLNPEKFGVAKIENRKITKLIEKPIKPASNLAITGMYLFDHKAIKYSKKLKFSKRGETEIVDLLRKYLKTKKLKYHILGRGTAWLDTGTYEGIHQASGFVNTIEKRQGFKIACIEEIAFKNKWIDKKKIIQNINFYGNCSYSQYLKKIIK